MEYGEKYIKYKGRIVFGKQSMPYFKRIPKEYTENEACFVFVNEGEFSVRSQEEYFNLNKNQMILAKCLNYFFETNSKQVNSGDGVEVVAVLIYPSLVKEIFEFDITKTNYDLGFNIKQLEVDHLLNIYRESINVLLDNPEIADENLIVNKLKEFVLLMTKKHNAPSQLDFLSSLFKPIEISFKKTILKNLYSNLSVNDLATLCHMSLSSFKRKFYNVFDESPKKYISKKKVQKAAELLKINELRISDIAFEVGYDSIATFNRNFLSVFGESPSEFRISTTNL